MSPTRFLVLRHGQSEWNAMGRWQGQADIELTDLGYEQARRAADRLGMFDAVASSDLRRARITATIIAETLGMGLLEPDTRLRETHVGEWQGLTHDQIERDWPGYLEAHLRPPGFEQDEAIVERLSSAFTDLSTQFPGGNLLVVAHAGVIRVLRRHLGVPDRRVANLGGSEFVVHTTRDGISIEAGELVDLLEHGDIGEEL